MTQPDRLQYFEDFIPDDLYLRILDFIEEELEDDLFPVSSSIKSRMVAHYGYRYDYKSGNSRRKALPFSDIIRELCDLIPVDDTSFSQCIVNRYNPGQGIGSHVDHSDYGPVIACFTILGGAEMEFRRNDEVFKLFAEPRSLYIMSGESRREWSHQMRPRKKDPGHGNRTVRYSFTYRSFK